MLATQDGNFDVQHSSSPDQAGSQASIRIWDIPVRLFHWTLVAAVVVAGVTGWLLGVNWLGLHLIAGSTIALLLLLRLVWGFSGSAYSRFASFAIQPANVMAHVKELRSPHPHREPGHNPLGALMVIALMFTLAAIVLSGALALGGAFKQGPFKSLVSFAAGWQARELHQVFAYGLLALVAAHLGGVVFESRRTRENLAASMVTGRKRAGFAQPLLTTAARPVAAAVAAVLLAGGAVAAIVSCNGRPPLGVPVMTANAAWAKECAACHIAFHPSLLPADSWAKIMDTLPDHFGEDASLDEATATEIKDFLVTNSAEHWDTLPANRLRNVDAAKPLEITATRFWTRMHGGIGDAVFTSKPVGAKQNCAACHGDAASGMFAPQMISIPKESAQ